MDRLSLLRSVLCIPLFVDRRWLGLNLVGFMEGWLVGYEVVNLNTFLLMNQYGWIRSNLMGSFTWRDLVGR
jgi:hypothetical protein